MLRPVTGRRSRFRTAVAAALALAVASSLLTACNDAADRPSAISDHAESGPRPTEGSADGVTTGFPNDWQPSPVRWAPCDIGVDTECASLEVPLAWDDPSGPTITLALGRTRATGQRIGSLLTNPGGPGASGLEFIGWEPFEPEITERFDVVSWDPRGVGKSNPPTCGSGVTAMLSLDPDPDDDAEQRQLEGAAEAVSRECATTDPDLLAHVGTADAARDMEAIRRAIGDEPLNYVGFSYGTQLGQSYAAMFPGEIRALVLDAVVDPAVGFEDFLLGQTAAFDASFERGAAACAQAGRSDCGVADLAAAYDEVAARVERAPIGSGEDQVGPSELATGAILTSYYPDGWRDLGPALAAALAGDGADLRYLADSYWDLGGYTSYAAVVCIDTPPPRGAEAYAAFADRARSVSRRFGAAIANELLPCATWPVEPVGRPEAITASGAPPILVIGNTGDAATPYENAVTVAERLESGVMVTADIEGHAAYPANPCVSDVVNRYLIRLEVPEADPHCT